ncbi:MAG TPA: ABC transporter ATP-binding protein [Candidatus Dormibacteraeota bacterium]|nr:ABC transporter ATP-binding protein [Candidatus Dormibacteraeota bacterium]
MIPTRPLGGDQVAAPLDRRGAEVVLRGVSHRYGAGRAAVTVLTGLDLDLPAGGYLALMGPSGAGKSTALALIGGLERPQQGTVVVGGYDLTRLTGDALATYRRRTVGFVFQHFGLLGTLTAHENVALAMALDGLGAAERRARAQDLLDAVGLGPRAQHFPAALSGGERQRVAIARALANRPRLILADEPTGNLDAGATGVVLDLLASLRTEHGCGLLVVTHNPLVARRADTVRELVNGRLSSP